MSNSDLERKWVDDVTSSNSQPSIQQPMPPGVGNEFSESVGGEKELEPEMDVDPPENREIPQLSVDSANSAAVVSNRDKQTAKDIQTDEPAHATECDRDGGCDEPKTEQSDDYEIFEQAEFGSKDVEMQIESHQSVENGGKSSVNVEQPEHHDDPLPRVDSADPSTSISKPDEETKPEKLDSDEESEVEYEDYRQRRKAVRNKIRKLNAGIQALEEMDERLDDEFDDRCLKKQKIFEQAGFGSEDVEMQIESHQSVENGGKSSVNVEQPEHHDDPLPRVDSADPSTSISKPDEETNPEKDIHTNELILDPDYARGGNSDEQTTEQLDDHELPEDTGLDSEDVDDEMDAKSEKSAKEDSDGKEPSVIDISSDSDDDENVNDSDHDENDSSEEDSDEESLVDLAIVPDKETNSEKDTLSVEDIDRLKRLGHGELIRRIMHSEDALNCPAFNALKAKKERRLLNVDVKANGTVKLELARTNQRISNMHYVHLKTCMILLMTKNDWHDLGIQLVSLINILMHAYDVSESCFDFKTLDFDDRHNSLLFESCFNSSPDKINIKYLDMGKNKVLAPLLQFVLPKCLHIGFPSASLLDGNGKLMTSDIDELHLNCTDDRVDRVMEQCYASDIYLSKHSIWTDDSIKKVLTAHAKNIYSKRRTIHGNCSSWEKKSVRASNQWSYLEDKWKLACLKINPIPSVASVKIGRPHANQDEDMFCCIQLYSPLGMTI